MLRIDASSEGRAQRKMNTISTKTCNLKWSLGDTVVKVEASSSY